MKKPTPDDFLPLIHVYPSRVDRNRLKAIPGVEPLEVLKRLASQVDGNLTETEQKGKNKT